MLIKFWPPRSAEILEKSERTPAIDVLRGIAILAVVLFHAESFRMGFLGVDLFFVISGYLVGGILIKQILAGQQIRPANFILSRGLKIWPSYYFFLFAGTVVAYFLYATSSPKQLIPLAEWPRYLFFYRNYRGGSHPAFDHIWSLCVEEHFYLLLPAVLVVMQKFGFRKPLHLVFAFGCAVAAGIAGKLLGWLVHFETYSATHNRLDALAWGCLLWLAFNHYGVRVRGKLRGTLLAGGMLGIVLSMALFTQDQSQFFNKVLIYVFVPILFAAIALSILDLKLPRLSGLRYLGYYSYNWYLWHPLFMFPFIEMIPSIPVRAVCYTIFTFLVGVAFTMLIEEPVLAHRTRIIEATGVNKK